MKFYFHNCFKGDTPNRAQRKSKKTPQGTLFIEAPHADVFKGLVIAATTKGRRVLTMMVGLSWCHPDDNFSKKIGREIAESKSQTVDFDLESIKFEKKGEVEYMTEIVLTSQFAGQTLVLKAVISPSSDFLRINPL